MFSCISKLRSTKRAAGRHFGVGRLSLMVAALACMIAAAAGVTSAGAATAHKSLVTLTELDYYDTPPDSTALPKLLNACAAQAGAKIQRQSVPQADLVPKLLQDVSAHSFPNLGLLDNPDVQQFAATGAIVPLTSSTKGLFPSIVSAGAYKGKTYGLAPGVNTIALYYNKSDFKAAGLTPPTTWAQLKSDASALTKGTTEGLAFSAPDEEENSWDFEPFFWSNGAELNKLSSSAAVGALTFYDSLVSDGSVSKSVVTWTQADAEAQFAAGEAAMMVNGPWQLPVLDTSAVKGNFGIVTIPVPAAGDHPITPLGGEMWTVGRSGGAKQKAAQAVAACMVSKKKSLQWSELDGYLSSNEANAKAQVAKNPLLKAFGEEIVTARARTGPPANLGPNYNTVSAALTTAVQAALSGSKTPAAALQAAQSSLPSGQ
jgi:multiple sugar transport system substrate-binding protein